jgi:tol-pal system protein YbgF
MSLKSFNYETFHSQRYDVASPRWRRVAPALVGLAAVLVTGCAARSSVNRLGTEVNNLRVEMHHLSQAQQTTSGELARSLAESRPIAARTVETSSALQEAQAEIARLRSRVEALESEVREAKLRTAALAAPTASPSMPAPALVSPPTATEPAAASRATPVPKARSAPPAGPPAERPRQAATVAPSPERVYGAALATFRAREHGQAVLEFLDFIAKHPRHPLVANAQYWIGEAYYAQRDYRQALTEFAKVPVTAPRSAKAGDALLKIGLCQRNLRDERSARLTWQRVVSQFPESEAAAKARAFLRAEAGTARH